MTAPAVVELRRGDYVTFQLGTGRRLRGWIVCCYAYNVIVRTPEATYSVQPAHVELEEVES